MLPVLSVYLDGSTTAVEVRPDTLAMYTCEDLFDKALSVAPEYGIRLVLAYIGVTGEDPANFAAVKKWARTHKAIVDVGDPVDPTQPAPTGA